MEQTLHDLSEILLRAIPTIIILVLLHNFLKAVLFGPMEKMLKQRGELTHGARHAAEASLANAERKTADYEAKLRESNALDFDDLLLQSVKLLRIDDTTRQRARRSSPDGHTGRHDVVGARSGSAEPTLSLRAVKPAASPAPAKTCQKIVLPLVRDGR